MESLGTEAKGGKRGKRGKGKGRPERKEKRERKGRPERKEKREKKGRRERKEKRERKGRRERKERKEKREKKGRRERKERKERKERRYWRRRKERGDIGGEGKRGDIRDGRRKGASLLKSCTKRVKSSFLLRIMLKMLHFNANRNLFCNFVLRTAVITKFSFPKI